MFLRHQKTLATALLAVLIAAPAAESCTLWAAAGNAVQGGGTVIVKNRDWTPGEEQTLSVERPEEGYAYAALLASHTVVGAGGKEKKLSRPVAGVNEKGLVVISATAGGIPGKERRAMPSNRHLMRQLLTRCASVDAAMALDKSLFLGPRILMLADKEKIAVVEIGPEGAVEWSVRANGTLAHTNHYLEPAMLRYNKTIGESSSLRHARIEQLLRQGKAPQGFPELLSFTRDQNAGPDNSIFRVGSTPTKTRTVSVFAVFLPASGTPELYVRLLESDKPETAKTYALNTLIGLN